MKDYKKKKMSGCPAHSHEGMEGHQGDHPQRIETDKHLNLAIIFHPNHKARRLAVCARQKGDVTLAIHSLNVIMYLLQKRKASSQ